MDDKQKIFEKVKSLLEKYSDRMKVTNDSDKRYDLYTHKQVEFMGKVRDGVYFASVIIQKGFVGFYFMPVYTDEGAKAFFRPELFKLLKGKSCFHLKKYDDLIFKQIEDVVEKGYEMYVKKGWA